jgi:iron complex transport system substrate-binding protein
MKQWRGKLRFLLGLACASIGSEPSWARDVVDQIGRKVELPAYPARVVAAAPSLAELAADLLGTNLHRLIGVSEYSDQPQALKRLPSVGPYHQLNLEKILALKPDLVLATVDGNSRDQIAQLSQAGIRVIVVSTQDIEEIAAAMRLVGVALGQDADGARMAKQFLTGIERIRSRAQSQKIHPRVLVQVGDDPIVVAGGSSFLNEALEVIGAKNSYGDLRSAYPRPALEDILHRDPDVILVLTLSGEIAPHLATAKRWQSLKRLKAARNGQVHIIQSDSVVRPTLRLIEGLGLLEKAIFGDSKSTRALEVALSLPTEYKRAQAK